jgi:hypothetical protein
VMSDDAMFVASFERGCRPSRLEPTDDVKVVAAAADDGCRGRRAARGPRAAAGDR